MHDIINLITDELFTSFSDVKYYDEPHKYYVNNKELISVTTLLHEYVEPFQEDYWAGIKAIEFGLTPHQIKRVWHFINKKGTMKGSIVHDYAENLFLNKVFKYPKETILDEFGFDPITVEYLMTKKHVDLFYNDVKNKLIPIKTEYVVYDKKTHIGGMIDMLFYNVKSGKIELWDYKTNKNLSLSSTRRLLGDLSILEASDLNIYSLQLGLYKYIIENNTNIKLGQSYLISFSHNNPTYKIIKTNDVSQHISRIIFNRLNVVR